MPFDNFDPLTLRISLVVYRPKPCLSGDSRERCQRISGLPEVDHSFPCLSSMEFLTNVGLIPARIVVELVDAPLEMGMVLLSPYLSCDLFLS